MESEHQPEAAPDHVEPVGGPELDLSGLAPTGDARVDQVLGRLRDLSGAGLSEQVAIYEEVQRGLQSCLTESNQLTPAGPAGRSG